MRWTNMDQTTWPPSSLRKIALRFVVSAHGDRKEACNRLDLALGEKQSNRGHPCPHAKHRRERGRKRQSQEENRTGADEE